MNADAGREMASCDVARWAWFGGVPAAAGVPDRGFLDWVSQERAAIRQEEGGGVQSEFLAEAVARHGDWPVFRGVFLSPDGDPVAPHCWNLLPGGAILDGAADAYGGGAEPRVVTPDDPAWRRYRAEWTPAYNPSLAAGFPELGGCLWRGRHDIEHWIERMAAQAPSPAGDAPQGGPAGPAPR